MVRINWQGQDYEVRRLVVHGDDRSAFGATVRALADEFRLELADDATDPRRGDFWVGCHPRAGWGLTDPAEVGWASVVEVPVALAALWRSVPRG